MHEKSPLFPAAQRLLVIRPSALGDVCRSVPVLVSLRRAYPTATIDWLVQDSFADAISAHPDLSNVVVFPRRTFRKWMSPSVATEMARWLRGLSRRRYDLVLDCQGLLRSGVFAWATRAPVRVGYADAREGGHLGVNRRVEIRSEHAVERMLELVSAIGVEPVRDLRLYVPARIDDAALAKIDPRLVAAQASGGLAVVAPTSRWEAKRWPADRFAALTEAMLASGRFAAVAVVGAGSERDQCGPLVDLASRDRRVIDLIGRTSVGELMAVIQRAAMVVANDSAAVHMAVGLGRPFVGLFGPTEVEKVGPYRAYERVVQHLHGDDPKDHKDPGNVVIMERISVDEVMAKLLGA